VSSRSSGGDDDSTGLRAEPKLSTPLLRCESLVETYEKIARFENDTAKRKGEPLGSPCCFVKT
jgi:hypothetical protein